MNLRNLIAAVVGAACMALAPACYAQGQRARPLKIVVPYPPGGIADSLARAIATPLGVALERPVIVDNRAGAAGTVGAAHVKAAEPNGSTLLFTNVGPSAIAPAMSKSPLYDPTKDFVAVSLVSRSPGFKDLSELIAAAKAKPGSIEYSSAGIGSFGHLATVLFAKIVGIELLHVPYQGGGPATTAVLAGEVKLSLTAPSAQMFEMAKDGRVRLLGVSSHGASILAPGVAPISNVVPEFEAEYWFGFVAPAKTPDATVQMLYQAIDKILADPAIEKQFLGMGNEVARMPPAEFQRLIYSEAQRWRSVVKDAKVEAN